MSGVKVTVIIPVYNMEKYIETCIRSVLKQTQKEIEVLCINDGSTDKSTEIILGLKEEFGNITLYNRDKQGAGVARNFGIERAKGEYIAFLDADDYFWDESALEKMICFCNEKSLNICGSYRISDIDGMIEEAGLLKEFSIEETGTVICYRDAQYDFDYQSFIYRKEFLSQNKIRFPSYRRYQDPPFFVNAMIASGYFGVVPVTLYCYRMGHQSSNVIREGILDLLRGVESVLRIASEHDLQKLYEVTLWRINEHFYDYITENLSFDILKQLIKIAELNQESKCRFNVRIIEEIKDLSHIQMSCGLLDKISFLQYKNARLQEYLETKKIERVAIKGCGKFGAYLARLLKTADVCIVGAVDRTGESSFDEFNGIDIYFSEAELPAYDALIVSPIKPEELMEECEKQGLKNVYSFVDILNEIFEKDRE